MSEPAVFKTAQAVVVAEQFAAEGVEYLFIGKSGAILLGFPGHMQGVHLFPEKSEENGRRILAALEKIGFVLDERMQADITRGKDFVQIKTGPFPLDLIFAPDGIPSFEAARKRRIVREKFPIAALEDIITSKRASGREKDMTDLPLLEDFRKVLAEMNPRPLRSAADIAREQKRED